MGPGAHWLAADYGPRMVLCGRVTLGLSFLTVEHHRAAARVTGANRCAPQRAAARGGQRRLWSQSVPPSAVSATAASDSRTTRGDYSERRFGGLAPSPVTGLTSLPGLCTPTEASAPCTAVITQRLQQPPSLPAPQQSVPVGTTTWSQGSGSQEWGGTTPGPRTPSPGTFSVGEWVGLGVPRSLG